MSKATYALSRKTRRVTIVTRHHKLDTLVKLGEPIITLRTDKGYLTYITAQHEGILREVPEQFSLLKQNDILFTIENDHPLDSKLDVKIVEKGKTAAAIYGKETFNDTRTWWQKLMRKPINTQDNADGALSPNAENILTGQEQKLSTTQKASMGALFSALSILAVVAYFFMLEDTPKEETSTAKGSFLENPLIKSALDDNTLPKTNSQTFAMIPINLVIDDSTQRAILDIDLPVHERHYRLRPNTLAPGNVVLLNLNTDEVLGIYPTTGPIRTVLTSDDHLLTLTNECANPNIRAFSITSFNLLTEESTSFGPLTCPTVATILQLTPDPGPYSFSTPGEEFGNRLRLNEAGYHQLSYFSTSGRPIHHQALQDLDINPTLEVPITAFPNIPEGAEIVYKGPEDIENAEERIPFTFVVGLCPPGSIKTTVSRRWVHQTLTSTLVPNTLSDTVRDIEACVATQQ